MELKKRGLVVSGPKPVLVDRLRPVLEEIIAAGRQQFQQPYKQISIPKGGLIILKPSPNSQLLNRQVNLVDLFPVQQFKDNKLIHLMYSKTFFIKFVCMCPFDSLYPTECKYEYSTYSIPTIFSLAGLYSIVLLIDVRTDRRLVVEALLIP